LRRDRATIGPWLIELITENDAIHRLFTQHWDGAATNRPPDAYCYVVPRMAYESVSRELADCSPTTATACAICLENGRSVVPDSAAYVQVNWVCDALMTGLATRRRRAGKPAAERRTEQDAWLLPAACIEYQAETGETRSVALLGAPTIARTVQAYALARSKSVNVLVSDGVTCAQMESLNVARAKPRVLWPVSLVRTFRHLLPVLAMSPCEGLQLDSDLASSLREFRSGSDLARAIDAGSFLGADCDRLAGSLIHGTGHSLIDPEEFLGRDRCVDQSQLTDVIRCRSDGDSKWIIAGASVDDFLSESSVDLQSFAELASTLAPVHRAYLAGLLDSGRVRCTLINELVPPAQMQFCLRHFLEGLSESVQVLAPDSFNDASVLQAMRLESRVSREWESETPISFVHGAHPILLVGFRRQGMMTELVAFDAVAEGYAQVRSVWPGQVADFFTRHARLRARDLFAEQSIWS
jgi:hypothetical protein